MDGYFRVAGATDQSARFTRRRGARLPGGPSEYDTGHRREPAPPGAPATGGRGGNAGGRCRGSWRRRGSIRSFPRERAAHPCGVEVRAAATAGRSRPRTASRLSDRRIRGARRAGGNGAGDGAWRSVHSMRGVLAGQSGCRLGPRRVTIPAVRRPLTGGNAVTGGTGSRWPCPPCRAAVPRSVADMDWRSRTLHRRGGAG